ncbi:MAG: signal recognition particle protein, partial [Planctomycetota bacterium]
DFKNQLEQVLKPGLMKKLLGLMPGMGDIQRLMGDTDSEKDARRLVGIINSMTPAERRQPKLIDPSRRNRIAKGAGVQTQEVSQLIKQYEFMAPMMKAMAGEGMLGRLKKVRELQESGALNPGADLGMLREKKGTGKRLSNKEKMDLRKRRDKELRRRKRLQRGGGPVSGSQLDADDED